MTHVPHALLGATPRSRSKGGPSSRSVWPTCWGRGRRLGLPSPPLARAALRQSRDVRPSDQGCLVRPHQGPRAEEGPPSGQEAPPQGLGPRHRVSSLLLCPAGPSSRQPNSRARSGRWPEPSRTRLRLSATGVHPSERRRSWPRTRFRSPRPLESQPPRHWCMPKARPSFGSGTPTASSAAFRQAAELLERGIPIEQIPFPIGCFPPRQPMVRARPSQGPSRRLDRQRWPPTNQGKPAGSSKNGAINQSGFSSPRASKPTAAVSEPKIGIGEGALRPKATRHTTAMLKTTIATPTRAAIAAITGTSSDP